MSTSVTTISTAAPLAVSVQGGTLDEVFELLETGLTVLANIPATAAAANITSLATQIISGAVQRIEQQTGKPIDLSQIPVEVPLPPPAAPAVSLLPTRPGPLPPVTGPLTAT